MRSFEPKDPARMFVMLTETLAKLTLYGDQHPIKGMLLLWSLKQFSRWLEKEAEL